MTPFASVAMLEKLALLKIALCRAPALSSASSVCLRTALPGPPVGPAGVFVPCSCLAMLAPRLLVLAPIGEQLWQFKLRADFGLIGRAAPRHMASGENVRPPQIGRASCQVRWWPWCKERAGLGAARSPHVRHHSRRVFR